MFHSHIWKRCASWILRTKRRQLCSSCSRVRSPCLTRGAVSSRHIWTTLRITITITLLTRIPPAVLTRGPMRWSSCTTRTSWTPRQTRSCRQRTASASWTEASTTWSWSARACSCSAVFSIWSARASPASCSSGGRSYSKWWPTRSPPPTRRTGTRQGRSRSATRSGRRARRSCSATWWPRQQCACRSSCLTRPTLISHSAPWFLRCAHTTPRSRPPLTETQWPSTAWRRTRRRRPLLCRSAQWPAPGCAPAWAECPPNGAPARCGSRSNTRRSTATTAPLSRRPARGARIRWAICPPPASGSAIITACTRSYSSDRTSHSPGTQLHNILVPYHTVPSRLLYFYCVYYLFVVVSYSFCLCASTPHFVCRRVNSVIPQAVVNYCTASRVRRARDSPTRFLLGIRRRRRLQIDSLLTLWRVHMDKLDSHEECSMGNSAFRCCALYLVRSAVLHCTSTVVSRHRITSHRIALLLAAQK